MVELRHSDVDINPQYSDGIDSDALVINLMFESNPALIGNVDKSHKDSMLPRFSRQGMEAFEAGLDEVSRRTAAGALLQVLTSDRFVDFEVSSRSARFAEIH